VGIASRTLDWQVSDDPVLWAVPEGTKRAAGQAAWESRFGVVGLSMWDSGTADAMNTAGLAAHLLYLGTAGFAPSGTPGAIPNLLWAQWVLDHCATVDEAVTALHDLPIVSVPVRGQNLGCHLALEDSHGDSAIVEPIDGKRRVHHGPQYQVMANDPAFDEQLEHLRQYRPDWRRPAAARRNRVHRPLRPRRLFPALPSRARGPGRGHSRGGQYRRHRLSPAWGAL
jgi:penicillin V acylase-like amidase (Ntn superfamily)